METPASTLKKIIVTELNKLDLLGLSEVLTTILRIQHEMDNPCRLGGEGRKPIQ